MDKSTTGGAIVDGHSLFYREAGAPSLPHVILLHGYPTSSHMYRHLIRSPADRYHVVAPTFWGSDCQTHHKLLISTTALVP